MSEIEGDKAFTPEASLRNSVIDRPPVPNGNNALPTTYDTSQLFLLIGQAAEEFAPWGRGGKLRDQQLRAFITQEPIFASALGIIASRNAGFSWKVDGPASTVERVQEILNTANFGEGWHDLIIKTSIDLYTQDFGAFWEIVREERDERAPLVGINHLDAYRCYHTGAPQAPVAYMDTKGNLHLLKWFEVVTFAEMPAAIEGMYGRQYSVLTRLLRKMQIQRNIDIYEYEKTAGRNYKAIHLVKGITSRQLSEAITEAKTVADASGMMRYMNPIVVGTMDPKADVGHDTIEMAGMPEGYQPEIWFKQYINQIAMAFQSDYQEFAPLPGGGLGTGAQSEMLHLKSRGKGPGLFMKLISHALNFRVLPKNVNHHYTEQDLEAEHKLAEIKGVRAQTRSVRITSGEITPEVARQLANDDGDLPLEMLALMGEQDVTEDVTIQDDLQARQQIRDTGDPLKPGAPAPQSSGGGPKRAPTISAPTPLGPKLRRATG